MEQRLVDVNNLGVGKANPDAFERKDYAYGWNNALQAITEASPTIDPETLPVVRELREELARVTAERDGAVKDLKKWSVCATCKIYRPKSRKSNCQLKTAYLSGGNWAGCSKWEWRGPQKEE